MIMKNKYKMMDALYFTTKHPLKQSKNDLPLNPYLHLLTITYFICIIKQNMNFIIKSHFISDYLTFSTAGI